MEHPRLFRAQYQPPKTDWLGQTLKLMVFGWLMWLIWAPVLAVIGFLALAFIGAQRG